jgi:putative transposase
MRALELAQIDHTLADIIVVDEIERRPIGRPWLTLVIDVATRVIAGFHLSLDAPSSTAVALALSHAVLPKRDFKGQPDLSASWPVEGLPQTIHLDNAKEFHGPALKRGCREYGISLTFRPPKTPHFGGHIERLIGTMMGDLHLLPGTTFSSVKSRGDYKSAANANLSMRELEQWLTLQIVEVYHQREHRVIGVPPLAAWTRSLVLVLLVVDLTIGPNALDCWFAGRNCCGWMNIARVGFRRGEASVLGGTAPAEA